MENKEQIIAMKRKMAEVMGLDFYAPNDYKCPDGEIRRIWDINFEKDYNLLMAVKEALERKGYSITVTDGKCTIYEQAGGKKKLRYGVDTLEGTRSAMFNCFGLFLMLPEKVEFVTVHQVLELKHPAFSDERADAIVAEYINQADKIVKEGDTMEPSCTKDVFDMEIGEQWDWKFGLVTREVLRISEDTFEIHCFVDGWETATVAKMDMHDLVSGVTALTDLDWK